MYASNILFATLTIILFLIYITILLKGLIVDLLNLLIYFFAYE